MSWRSKLPGASTAPPPAESCQDPPARAAEAADGDSEKQQNKVNDAAAGARPEAQPVAAPAGQKQGLGSVTDAPELKQKAKKAARKELAARQKKEVPQGAAVAAAGNAQVARTLSEAQARPRAQPGEVCSVVTPPHFKSLPFRPTRSGRGERGSAKDKSQSQRRLLRANTGEQSGSEVVAGGDLQAPGTAAAVPACMHAIVCGLTNFN